MNGPKKVCHKEIILAHNSNKISKNKTKQKTIKIKIKMTNFILEFDDVNLLQKNIKKCERVNTLQFAYYYI